MVADPRGHAARQLFNNIAKLEAVPDLRRETYFLSHDGPMAKADRTAREIKALRPDAAEAARHNIDPEALMKRLADHSRTTEKIRTTLETIHETRGQRRAPRTRGRASEWRSTQVRKGQP